ncbi:tetratricopeptide repeat protein [Aneurinibacillus aneurinilyticus]|uniref:tetratricopeptide repeat protein n=1 Tax=Aneurinibacillus aneurinilyticus TaxID=1391 RepID=UPI003525AFDC
MEKEHSRLKGQEGVHYFAFLCSKLNYLFREVLHHDKGVDCEIEITQSLDVESPIVAVQVKSRSEFYITKDNNITLTVTQQNLDYWRSYGRPVILVAYTDDKHPLYWTRVDNIKSRTIRISLSDKFDETTLQEFSRIITEYYCKLARNLKIKDLSQILAEFGFVDTLDEVLDPIVESLKEAQKLIEEQKFREASEVYGSLARIYKRHCLINYNWGLCLLYLEEIDKVFDVIDFIYREFPNRYEPLELLANAFASIGEYEAAEENLMKALKIEPHSPNIWNSIGLLHYWQGDYLNAINEFTISLEYQPDAFVYFNLALCATAIRRYDNALEYYDEAIKLNNKFYDAYNNKGLLLKDLWRLNEALQCFEKAIEINPEHTHTLCNCGYLLKDMGENERALEYYKDALEGNPNHEHIHLNLALLYCRNNDFLRASYHFDKSLNMLSIPNHMDEKILIGISDIGYEVTFLITLEITNLSTSVVDVENLSEISLFKKVPLMRNLVEYAQDKNVTVPLTGIDPANKIEIQKENQVVRKNRWNKKVRKANRKGIWFFGAPKSKDNEKYGIPFAIFSVEDEAYFKKVTKEIQRRVTLLNKTDQDKLGRMKINENEFEVCTIDKIDSCNQIEIRFEDRITGDIYFNINFNGYYLAGLTAGNLKETFKDLKKAWDENQIMTIILQYSTESTIKMFSVSDIKKVLFK